MATREEIGLALQRFVADAQVLSEDGRVMIWADGSPVVLSLLDAIRALEELGFESMEPAPADGTCPHPPARRRPAGVMGAPDRFLCLACSQLVTPEAADGTARDRSE